MTIDQAGKLKDKYPLLSFAPHFHQTANTHNFVTRTGKADPASFFDQKTKILI
jgi:hypothetical protein